MLEHSDIQPTIPATDLDRARLHTSQVRDEHPSTMVPATVALPADESLESACLSIATDDQVYRYDALHKPVPSPSRTHFGPWICLQGPDPKQQATRPGRLPCLQGQGRP